MLGLNESSAIQPQLLVRHAILCKSWHLREMSS